MELLARLAVLIALCMSLCDASLHQYASILAGADGRYDLSRGNQVPFVTRPWGFNGWAPQTDNDPTSTGWFFHPNDRRLFGIRCTHQPSPWIADYGNFLIQSSLGSASGDQWRFSAYEPSKSTWKPYLFNASLLAYGSRESLANVSVTSTQHGAVIRFRYPHGATSKSDAWNPLRRLSVVLGGSGSLNSDPSSGSSPLTLYGATSANSGGVPNNFNHYFYMTIGGGADGNAQLTPVQSSISEPMAWMAFNSSVTDITVRIATSLISADQAKVAHAAEVGTRTFEDVLAESEQVWAKSMSVVEINDVGSDYTPQEQSDMLEVYGSALYRGMLFPRFAWETSANGSDFHWSAYDPEGGIYPGVATTDSGFWDAYRTVYSMQSLFFPSQLGTLIQAWVNAYKEGGWLPKWASPGNRGSMTGTMGDVVLADAIIKKIPGFDVQDAYDAIRQDAFKASSLGRICLEQYVEHGYIPSDGSCSAAVSRTQNYWLSDFAIAQAAKFLGNHGSDYDTLMARAMNYSLLFDSSTGFFRGRGPSGFSSSFDEFAWGGDYTEAGPWQYRFYVPHDPIGLSKLYKEAGQDMCDVIETMQTMPSVFHVGGYGSEIHEMTEMASLCWGQYEHNNQPVHHVLWMLQGASDSVTSSCSQRGHFWTRKVLSDLYNAGPAMFVGDEDNGEMSSWYLLSALGLYQLLPSTPYFVLGSPLFSSVTVQLQNGQALNIVAHNNSKANVYVSKVLWNSQPISGAPVISYFDLMSGGSLEFFMSANPVGLVRERSGRHTVAKPPTGTPDNPMSAEL